MTAIKLLALSLLPCLCAAALAQEPAPPPTDSARRIAVLYFRDTTNIDVPNSKQTYLPPALATMLSTDLSNMAGVDLVERETVDALLFENKLGEAALTDEASAQKLGKTLAADVVLMGTLRTAKGFVRILPVLFYVAEGRREKLPPVECVQSDLIVAEAQVLKEAVDALKLKPAPVPDVSARIIGKTAINLAVLDLSNNAPPGSGENLCGSMADLLSSALSDSPRFKLVDRAQIHKVLEEQRLNLSGLTRENSTQVNKLLGAQLFLIASYTRSKDVLRVDVRIIHPESSRVLGAFKAQGLESSAAQISKNLASTISKMGFPDMESLAKAAQASPRIEERVSDEDLEEQFSKVSEEFRWALIRAFSFQPGEMNSFYLEDQVWASEIKAGLDDFARRFRRFAYLRPRNGKYRIECGLCLFEIGQYAAAREEFDAGEQIGVDASFMRLMHGNCLFREGKFQAAAEFFQKLGEDFPKKSGHAFLLAAEAWGRLGEVAKKRELLKRALEAFPQLSESEFSFAREMDVGYVTSQPQCRTVHEGYFLALESDPTNFKAFCNYIGHGIRFDKELDSYVQSKKAVENLNEMSERAGTSYLYILPPHQVSEWKAGEQGGFRHKSRLIDGDRDFRIDYKPGKGIDPKNDLCLQIGEGGYVIYKFKFPGAKRALLNVEGSDLVSASRDGINWIVVQKEEVPFKDGVGDERFRNPHYFNPFDISKALDPNGTVFVKFEVNPGHLSGISKILGIGLPK